MKKIYSSIFAVSALFAAASCQVEIESFEENAPVTVNGMTVTASMGAETKSVLMENGVSTYWTENDVISVFDSKKEDNNRRFEINESSFPAITATFSCTEEFTMPQNDQPDPLVVALYPYQENAYCDFFYYDRNYITGITIPVEQTAAEGGFDNTATFALATGKLSTKDELTFNNLYSLLKITLAEDGVKKVTVSVGEGEYIAGAAKVQLNLVEGPAFDGGTLSAVADGGSQSVSLVCEEGFATDKTYYLAVAPGTYSTITVALDDVVVKTIDTEKTLAPNTIYGLKNLDNPETSVVTDESELKTALADEDIKTIVLAQDMKFSEILTIGRSVTIDGNGKKLTSTADRAINVSGADGVTIKNLTIEASGERAVNIIQDATNVTIDKVTATAAEYTVNVAQSAPAAKVTISNSTLTGLNVVNVSSPEAVVEVTGCTINCNDNNDTKGEFYAALCLNKGAIGGKIIATGCTINITEGSDSEKGRNGAENGIVTIDGSTEGVSVKVAAITYEGTEDYHAFNTLAEAIEFTETGSTIILIRNIELTEGLTIPTGKTITLDLQDYTITLTPPTSGDTPTEIKNYGTLTLTGGKIIAEDDILTRRCIYNYGTMTINGTEFVQQYESKGAAINNASKMIITDATVESKYFCIWNENANGDLTINGGTFTCNSYTEPDENNTDANNPTYSYAIRNTSNAKLTINNGEFNCTHGFASIEEGSATTIYGGNVKFTGELNQSVHTFYIFNETTKFLTK